MNSYKFVLSYNNRGDARDAAGTIRAYWLSNHSPDAAASVRYVGTTVELTLQGNVSALSFAHALDESAAVYTVTPLEGSEPLLVRRAVSPTHVYYARA